MPIHRPLPKVGLLALTLCSPMVLGASPLAAAPPAKSAKPNSNSAPESEPAPEGADKIFPYSWEQRELGNGLRVVVIPMQSEGLVSYRTVVRTGSRDEYEKGVTGFAHFFEHMMFRGTEKYPAEKYNELITRMGASSNAYTSTDMTVYESDISKEDLELVVELEADRFMNLSYELSAFETEAGAVYGEYRKNASSPFFSLYETVRSTAFSRHTYAHTTMGFEADIADMPNQYDYSRKFFERYYRPENCVVVVTGDVEPEPTFALIERYYAEWKPGYVAPKIKPESRQRKARTAEIEYEGKTNPLVWVAYKGGAFDPSDRVWVASMVLSELAFGETSAIYQELLLDQQKVESIQAGAATNRDPGLFSIIAAVKDEQDIDGVLRRVEAAVVEFREQPVEQAKLDAVKSNMRYSYLLGLDTPTSVAGQVASFIGTTGDLAHVETLYQNLEAVTPEDVRTAAQRWLTDERRTTVILRQAKSKDEGPAATASKPNPKQSKPKSKSAGPGGAR